MRKKLDKSAVQKIRELYRTGEYKQLYLAVVFHISRVQVSRIVNFKRRKQD